MKQRNMNRKRLILRDESFGYTLFDRDRLTHTFLKRTDLDSLQRLFDIADDDFERWSLYLTDAPPDFIYSPIRIYFELTSNCNLYCKVCFNSSGKPKPNEMSGSEVRKTLDGLRRDGVLDIRFSGGEVTTRHDWFELLKYAKQLGFAVSLNTNGVYSNPVRTIDQLIRLDLEQITISIDGGSRFHDYIRGRGAFAKTARTLERLHNKGTCLRINTILTRGSKKDLVEILDLAGRFVEEINFFYMRPTGMALCLSDQIMSYDELYEFNKRIESLKPNYPHLRILHGSKVMIANSIDPSIKNAVGIKMGGPDGFTRFNLLPDGSIWPGGYTPHLRPDYNLGNIQKEGYSILNIWRNSNKLMEFRTLSFQLQKTCLACPEKNVRCPGASMEMEFYRKNSEDKINPYCAY